MDLLGTPGIIIVVAAITLAVIAILILNALLGKSPHDSLEQDAYGHGEIETPGTSQVTFPRAGQTARGGIAVPTTGAPARPFAPFHSTEVARD